MYTALIVDDEEELRHAIIEGVDLENIGFKVIGDAKNGVDALELAEKIRAGSHLNRYKNAHDDRT